MVFNKFVKRLMRLWKPQEDVQHTGSVVEEEVMTREGHNGTNIKGDIKTIVEQQTFSFGRPMVCPKCKYTARYIVTHEDGWQCLNCMKIIYKNKPMPITHHSRL